MQGLVELVMRLPAAAFWGLLVAGLVLGTVLTIAGIVLLVTKRRVGAVVLAAGIAGGALGLGLLICLVADLVCTGRSGSWIC